MDLDKAIGIIQDYLAHNLNYELDVLGKNHDHASCGCSLGEISQAFDVLIEGGFFEPPHDLNLESLIDKSKVSRLLKILENYSEILDKCEHDITDLIIKAYTFEKPLTSIEVYDIHPQKVFKFVETLEDFFFAGFVYAKLKFQKSGISGEILISRFRILFQVAMEYAMKDGVLSDSFADLAGLLFGYNPKEIAHYCLRERFFDLIKG